MSLPRDALSPIVDPDVQAYLATLSPPDDALLGRLEAHAAERGFPLIGQAAGRWLELLVRAIGGRRVFEMGSGFGYSGFFLARAVGAEGEVHLTEWDHEDVDRFSAFYRGHPLEPRLSMHHGRAEELLAKTSGLFDAIVLDLEKEDYIAALAQAVPRIRPGGLLLADNSLWGGRVARDVHDPTTCAVRAFNEQLHAHPQLMAAILPAGDGLAVGLKLP